MWYGLVVWWILAPTEPQVSATQPPEMWAALKEIAQALEVVGPHENWATDFRSELRYVRFYWRNLKDSPRLSDCYMLPPQWVAQEQCHFNERYQCHLQMQQVIWNHRAEEYGAVLRETRQLYQAWDCVRRASSTNQAWAYRRRMLSQLRDLLGEDAYYNGQMPPCVPVWHFAGMN